MLSHMFLYLKRINKKPWRVVQMIQSWMCYPMVTSSSLLKTIYLRKSLVLIVVHVAIKVLHVLIGLVEVCVSTECWPRYPMLPKEKKKLTKLQLEFLCVYIYIYDSLDKYMIWDSTHNNWRPRQVPHCGGGA